MLVTGALQKYQVEIFGHCFLAGVGVSERIQKVLWAEMSCVW